MRSDERTLFGVVLCRRVHGQLGAWVVLVSTVAGVAFESSAHFLVDNPDHISQTGHAAFAPTAAVSVLATGFAAVTAAWVLWCHRQGGSVRSRMESRT